MLCISALHIHFAEPMSECRRRVPLVRRKCTATGETPDVPCGHGDMLGEDLL